MSARGNNFKLIVTASNIYDHSIVRFDDLVAMAREKHPIPFRTRK